MEKYSQFRDRGSGITPFFPVTPERDLLRLALHIILFFVKLPLVAPIFVAYFLALQWFPLGSLIKKAALWLILGIPGLWWIDLQVDGVKKGSLAEKHEGRLPQPGDIIASSYTSPIDSLYLAAIFDPIFTASYPNSRQVERISLLDAVFRAFAQPRLNPPKDAQITDIKTLVTQNPQRVIVVFPECTTTNGTAIMPFSPSLLGAPSSTKIFATSLRYTPSDITTPVPGTYFTFLWNLLSRPKHCIRVRIAESVCNTSVPTQVTEKKDKYLVNLLDSMIQESPMPSGPVDINVGEKQVLDKVAEALARLSRVKRVGLTVKDKSAFVAAWTKGK